MRAEGEGAGVIVIVGEFVILAVCDTVPSRDTDPVADDVIVGVLRADIVIDCVTVEVFDTDIDDVVVPERRTDLLVVVERLIVTVPVGVRVPGAVDVCDTVIRDDGVPTGDPELVLDLTEEAVTVEDTVLVFDTDIERDTDGDAVLVFDVVIEPVEVRVIGGVRLTLADEVGEVEALEVFELLMDCEDDEVPEGVFETGEDLVRVGDEEDVFDTVTEVVDVLEDVIDFVWAPDAVPVDVDRPVRVGAELELPDFEDVIEGVFAAVGCELFVKKADML